jgi:PTH1 family peptidyl-tRNA hydrolase
VPSVQQESALWMVVGLGNPGPSYRANRHNVGFMVAERLGEGLDWRSSGRFEAQLAKGRVESQSVLMVKPQTYMNLSGRSVGPLARFYGIEPANVIAIHDDVDLPLGRLKVKRGGGDGGHKGIRSVAQELGSPDFIRIRFGVGRPARGDVTDFVLSDFADSEREEVAAQVERAADAVTAVITRGLRAAMNSHNADPKAKTEEEPEQETPDSET